MSKKLSVVVFAVVVTLGCQKPRYGLYRHYELGSYEPSVACFQAVIGSVEGIDQVKYRYELNTKVVHESRKYGDIQKLPEHIHRFTYGVGEFENSVVLKVSSTKVTKYHHYLMSENRIEGNKLVQDFREIVLEIEKSLEESCDFKRLSKQSNLICDVEACRK